MLIRSYTLRFITPAFLGNAEQSGQWRTPPIKALWRQWWRVAFAADQRGAVDVAAMRSVEAGLFGAAADAGSNKSQVRIRLNSWQPGKLKSWSGLEQAAVDHSEVKQTKSKVGPHAYLGYGPLDGRGGTQFGTKCHAAIQHNEEAVLSLAYPSSNAEAPHLSLALQLMNLYGTLGGRSRNGWGSFDLRPADAATPQLPHALHPRLTARWQGALALDWPHAMGCDEGGPLIWQTEALADWKTVMRRLAEIKIGLRTHFKFPNHVQPPHAQPLQRHWLSYPVGRKHNVVGWKEGGAGGEFRLPNSLRFKVRIGDDGKLHGVIFHVPCRPPLKFNPNPSELEAVWQQVHDHLNHPAQRLTRIAA